MATYKISFEITLNNNARHPEAWIPHIIGETLESGEFTESWVCEETKPDVNDES